jgi:hypothetical protein
MTEINFQTLKDFPNYEIQSEFPFQIREVEARKIIEIRKLKSVYLTVRLDKKIRLLHRVIAMQFIPNPDFKI